MDRGIRTVSLLLAAYLGCSAVYAPSPKGEPAAYCTVFNHLVKSGGTSIKHQLWMGSVEDGSWEPGICTFSEEEGDCSYSLHNASVITGYTELLRNAFVEIGRECSYFTMVRHPIDRLVSEFYYCPEDHDVQIREKQFCGNIEVVHTPLRDRLVAFAKKRGMTYFWEMVHSLVCPKQVFELCGNTHSESRHNPLPLSMETDGGWALLEKTEAILSTYAAVGIYEEWDLSMKLYDATVTSSVMEWDSAVLHNKGYQSKARQQLLEWARNSTQIIAALEADLHLYGKAVELFRNQTQDTLGTMWE